MSSYVPWVYFSPWHGENQNKGFFFDFRSASRNLKYTNNKHGMKHLTAFICTIAFLHLWNLSAHSQNVAFSAVNEPDQEVQLENLYTESGLIHTFQSKRRSSGVSISGDIWLNSDSSLVRIILVDNRFNEYLVYEAYPLLEGYEEFSINKACEETALLNNVTPLEMRVEIIDAVFFLKTIHLSPARLFMAKSAGDVRNAQQQSKIDRLNKNLEDRGIPWAAGETSISRLSYEEKKEYFGGELPNLNGFEYYAGGIFVMPGALDQEEQTGSNQLTTGAANSPYVKEFSWRNVHGQDWVSPVKNQSSCGSCWAFSATGATELMVNLYYNQLLDLDLSEQQVLSCSGAGSCRGGYPGVALDYIRSAGIVNEDCFPYRASDLSCSDICTNPRERISIDGYVPFAVKYIDGLKRLILDGPVSLGIIPWRHAITLVGYKTLLAGDEILVKTSSENRWISIDQNSPYINKTAWLIKNSWGSWWGDGGYAYIFTNMSDIYLTYGLQGPVTSLNYNPSDIACTDDDGDGYYYWGTGPKPPHCPPCPDEPDGDDSNPCFGPKDEFGNLQSFSSPRPITEDLTVFEGEPVPELTASGTNIKWYSDFNLSNLLHSGLSFQTGKSSVGVYPYYVTQSREGCESSPEIVILTILEGSTPPKVEDLDICQGDTGILKATGENIRWYENAELTILLHQGETYSPGITDPGYYPFYVTQSTGGVESAFAEVIFKITETPLPVYVEDRSFCTEEGLFLYAKGRGIRWYKSGFIDELIDERDDRSYKVVNIGTQVWMAENLNIGERIDGSSQQSDNGIIEKYNYNDDTEYGPDYGGLYQWDELMLYSTDAGARGICPSGWHIPSHDEWKLLEVELGMSEAEADKLGLRGSDEGIRLRAGGSSDFEALLGGKRNTSGYFENMDHYATFWTSDGYTRTLGESFDQVYASKGDDPETGFSVRCVMDESSIVFEGNQLDLADYTPGDYTFNVTTTTKGCESEPVSSTLTLKETPEPPLVPDVEACASDQSPILVAEGEGIKWYSELPEDPFTDQRDGRLYDAVGIGKQVWMAENLDVGELIPGNVNQSQNGTIEKYYYNNDPDMGAIYGGLYQWNELMNYTTLENTQGICPDGWEVPSNNDWMKLEMSMGMNQAEASLYEWRGTDEGSKLKEGGSSGFDVLFGGKRSEEGQFKSEYYYATVWNSSGFTRTFERGGEERPQIFCSRFDHPANGYSVRCILNDSAYSSYGSQMEIPGNVPGSYTFEVTQTVDGCESESTDATLTIREAPAPPLGKDTSLCEGDSIPALEALGDNIHWYSEENPDQVLFKGNSYQSNHVDPGLYNYHVRQLGTDCESLADTVSLEIRPRPLSPRVSGAEICEGDSVPSLFAEGVDIRWYSDPAMQNFLIAGPEFTPGDSEPGLHGYFATQTISECVSETSTASLLIKALPTEPQTENMDICSNDPLEELSATGENLKWYMDEALSEMIHRGQVLQPLSDTLGSQHYYVTQTLNACEGPPSKISLNINPIPAISLGNDTLIYLDETLILGPFLVEYNYLWNNATNQAFLIIDGEEYGVGDFPVSVQVMSDGCVFRDSITISIESRVGINPIPGSERHNIYPNPTEGSITLEFTNRISEDILFELYQSNGTIVQQFSYQDLPLISRSSFTIHLDTPGLYYLKIVEENGIYVYPVIKL